MDLSNIKERLYNSFGAGSSEMLLILIEFVNTVQPNLHKIAQSLGIGYRTVRDVACLFNEDIIIDDITDNICISECFRLEIEKYKVIEIIPNKKNIDNISNLLSGFDKHNPELDHISATVKCCYKRAVDLVKMYDLDYCKFLFLGDHDFTSLVFAMLCKNINKKPHIVVMDIDENVLSYIKQCSQKNGYDIETYYSDFRFVIPKKFNNTFDVIFTDPPYTAEGIGVFISKANQMIKKNAFSSLLICYKAAEQSNGLGIQVQRVINQSGLYIRELIKNYNIYETAEALGCRSDLYICLPTASIKKELDSPKYMYNIYTHGSNAVENNFSCKASILSEETLFFKDRNVFYIGDNLSILFPDRLRIDQFLYQKISGKFHISSQKEYVVDIRVMQDNLFRVLLFCDFERFLVISKPTAMKNCDLILYSLLEKSFKITQEFSSNNFTVFLFVKKISDNIIGKNIGKRATLKNSIVEELCTLYNITQNDARRILDEWNIEEISNAPIYFMPTYIISNINIFITSLKKTLESYSKDLKKGGNL